VGTVSEEPVASDATKPGCLGTIIGAVVLIVLAVAVKLLLWSLFGK
jgi:hypothetical protein